MFKLFQNCVPNELKVTPSIYALSVRWATKPRWVPIAKTKKFRIPVRHDPPPEDAEEIKRLYNNYRMQFNCVLKEIKRSYRATAIAKEVILKREKDVQDAWDKCMRINDEWNANVAIEREKRDKLELEARCEKARRKMELVNAEQALMQKNIDKLIREQQEMSKTFITEKSIDAHIQKILNEEPLTFNYAIDLQGRVYDGFSMNPNQDKLLPISCQTAEKSPADLSSSGQMNIQS